MTPLTLLLLAAVAVARDTREDGKCGPSNPAPVAPSRPLVLEQDSPRAPAQQVVSGGAGGVREDGRCGAEFDGAACDPNSAYFCCSAHGYCGGTGEHCSCDTCINYRPDSAGGGAGPVSVTGRVRSDRRCGAEFPLDDGEPSECDGGSENHCCSNWGYCGPGADHCECAACVDYRTAAEEVRGGVPPPRQLGPDPVRPEQRELLLQQVGLLRGRRRALRLPGVRQLQGQQINLYFYLFIA